MAKRNPSKSLPSAEQLLKRAYAAIEASQKHLSHFHRLQLEFDRRQDRSLRAQPNAEDLVREEQERKGYMEQARRRAG